MEGNVCSRLEGTDFKCRAQIPSMGHHTWLQISLLSLSLGLSSFCLRGDRAVVMHFVKVCIARDSTNGRAVNG